MAIYKIKQNLAKLTRVPGTWYRWPAQMYLFLDSLEDHLIPLLALGMADNEQFNLEVSFYDQMLKLRELWTLYFESQENYREVALKAKTDKRKSSEESKLLLEFNRAGLQVLNVKKGQFGQMRSLVAVDEKCWKLLLRIINRDYVEKVAPGKKTKGMSQKDAKSRKPLGNVAPLFEFANLDSDTLHFLLESVVEGRITFKKARDEAKERKAMLNMVKAFETRLNDVAGTKAKNPKDERWISYSSIIQKYPSVDAESYIWAQHFYNNRKKMSGQPLAQFNQYVDNALTLHRTRGSGSFSVSLPRAFKMVVTEQMKNVVDKDSKFKFIRSPIGKTAIMTINDTTQNLGNYVNAKSADFSKFLI